MSEHTALPWMLDGPYFIGGNDEVAHLLLTEAHEPYDGGRTIADFGLWLDIPEKQKANAHLVLLAANCHEGLVKALEAVLHSERSDCPECREPLDAHDIDCSIGTLLAKAKVP